MEAPKKDNNTKKNLGGAAGGALFGASVGGVQGALVGFVVGGIASVLINEEKETEPVDRDWHEEFKRWAKPPSDTEETKGSNAAGMIRKAIRESEKLASKNIDVYASGSYRNNTNVRLGSDIDIAVVLRDSFYYELPEGLKAADVGFSGSAVPYSFEEFREDVGVALRDKFGAKSVIYGNKAFNIRENSYRLDADATAFLAHRRYTGEKKLDGSWDFFEGVELRPRKNSNLRVVNWHDQHYEAGVAKNNRTNRRYKRVVRILKNLKYDMADCEQASAKKAGKISSFLLECLAFNAPDDKFNLTDGTYYDDVKNVIVWLWNNTKPDSTYKFTEVSGLKWLFSENQAWTKNEAHEFLYQAWRYVGFTND
jgi:predicted nucleotidyltransferase